MSRFSFVDWSRLREPHADRCLGDLEDVVTAVPPGLVSSLVLGVGSGSRTGPRPRASREGALHSTTLPEWLHVEESMPADFPYMNSVGHVPDILTRIQEAGAPPRFTHEFLKTTLGFTSSSDRGIIAVLKQLGFLSSDGSPTERYHHYRGGPEGRKALAQGLREGWSEIYLANERAHELTAGQLKEIFKSVTGKSDSVAEKMASTFKALANAADWSAPSSHVPSVTGASEPETPDDAEQTPPAVATGVSPLDGLALHHDVHVHLPPTSDVAVYRAIFRALRDELM